MKRKLFSLFLMLVLGFSALQADVIYVKADGTGGGTSWADATSLVDALSWAASDDVLYVAKGTYTGSFVCSKNIKVYGNCNGTETAPPVITSAAGLQTFLKGPGSGLRVLYLDASPSEWTGFDISEGDASAEVTGKGRGGGVYINASGAILKYCRIHDNIGLNNVPTGSSDKGLGGGIYILNGRLENSIVENNIASGVPVDLVAGPWRPGVGGGVFLDGAVGGVGTPETAVVLNCIIRNNKTTTTDDISSNPSQGGGIAIRSGYLVNSLVVGNTINGSNNNQTIGGGVATLTSTCYITNCTVVGNIAKGLGGGIGFQTTNAGGMRATVSNCIAWGNTSRADDYGIGNANIRFGSGLDAGLVDKVTLSGIICPETTVGASVITADPMFKDAANGDYTLLTGSPAIDAGDDPPVSAYATDLAGNQRIQGDAADIGAYEFIKITGLGDVIDGNGEIIETTYYTLQGLEIKLPKVSGFYIVKNKYSSLKTITKKLYINMYK